MQQEAKKDFIVIFTTVSFPYGNASDNAIFTFMDGFQEHGYEGEVVCLYPNSPAAHPVPQVGEFNGVKYRYLCKRTQVSRNRIVHFWDFWCNPVLAMDRYLKALCKDYNVTALFVTFVDRRFHWFSKICRKYGVKQTLVSCEYPAFLTRKPKALNRYNKFSEYIDKYIFETQTLADFEQKSIRKQIDYLVVPATMPFEDILASEKTGNEKYIAYTGSIFSDSKDGLSNILRAYAKFHPDYPGVGLKFIGRIASPSFYNSLLALVKELSLEDCVAFSGEVTREEYVSYLAGASLMIVAKPKDSYYVGGLSSKVIEYLFSANPVVMVAADDYVHYLTHGENVYFTEDNLPETLCGALTAMFDNPELMERIGRSGKEYALAHFNYHILTKEILGYLFS